MVSGIFILFIIFGGILIMYGLITNLKDDKSDEETDEPKQTKHVDNNLSPVEQTDIERMKLKYGLAVNIKSDNNLPHEYKKDIIRGQLSELCRKMDNLYRNGIIKDTNLISAIKNNESMIYTNSYRRYSDNDEPVKATIAYQLYHSIFTVSLMQSVNDEYIYAIDQEIFSFLIFNDFFMRGESKCTSEVTKRIQIKNFKFSTRGFETLYQDVKMYLDRIATSSSYSTVRVSELLNRYIKLNTPETIRINDERGDKFSNGYSASTENIKNYPNEIRLIEIYGLDFLIKYLNKYLDIVTKLEENVNTKSGYSQLLSKYNLTFQ